MSTPSVWEDSIALNLHDELKFDVLEAPAAYQETDTLRASWDSENLPIAEALERDTFPLPNTKDREGYYGANHFSYWASGLRDMRNLLDCAATHGVDVKSYFDFGCASGRTIRHFAANRPDIEVLGADINRRHIEFVNRYLPNSITAFQSHSIPTLPLPDNSIDLVSAFSVFTHIEAFETTWLMELRRIMKPGGLAWVTIHSDKTWEEVGEGWPLYTGLRNHPKYKEIGALRPMPEERLVFRWRSDRSYSSNVFYSFSYIHRVWGKYFDVAAIHRRLPVFQDVVILRKR